MAAARQGENGTVVHNATPAEYERWLAQTIEKARREPRENRVVFINAWNEWAEGAHLEPCVRQGRGFLEATRRALLAAAAPPRMKTKRKAGTAAAIRQ